MPGEGGEAAAWGEAEAEAGHIASAHMCDVTWVRGLLGGGKPPHSVGCSWVALGMAGAAAAAWGPRSAPAERDLTAFPSLAGSLQLLSMIDSN